MMLLFSILLSFLAAALSVSATPVPSYNVREVERMRLEGRSESQIIKALGTRHPSPAYIEASHLATHLSKLDIDGEAASGFGYAIQHRVPGGAKATSRQNLEGNGRLLRKLKTALWHAIGGRDDDVDVDVMDRPRLRPAWGA
ncbi:hypothetical protein BDY21DRAFT_372442 [Lineolata rhizophorae]|uniref:Uncharacterized protein n=1 Tax=Lineolata rhizophorae TaxID=578093 RepID=A0A6A6NXP9_9PEZI|nr:hypothetical protein BDY21DRAFT_372442 [Lineolata rhizophorae]